MKADKWSQGWDSGDWKPSQDWKPSKPVVRVVGSDSKDKAQDVSSQRRL